MKGAALDNKSLDWSVSKFGFIKRSVSITTLAIVAASVFSKKVHSTR